MTVVHGAPILDGPLAEAIEASPAVVWVKELNGRYATVNRCYEELLGVEADQVRGKTDTELARGESIEGLRVQAADAVQQEPLELEYTVEPFADRPTFTVLRFALRDEDGRPTATCGVAAPVGRSRLARSECERLMRLMASEQAPDRDAAPEQTESVGADVAALAAERDAALEACVRLEQQLAEARAELQGARVELQAVHTKLSAARERGAGART
jgi:PAS domain S-box-containing protein